ncbi:MAG: carbon starvation protein CstA [Planctomycetes bacterium SM23_25]|nr:MAG: carbon starvation protein CstA [Planctomycetes bacterium SM23_25]
MDALILVVVTFVGYLVAYHTYGRFLARKIFRLDDSVEAPSVRLLDGVDYVPTRRGIIFGHHYTSIAGTGPIVGPAIGIIWGWVPAIIWVFVGSIVLGAVHDFGALVVSMRNDGKSLSEVADRYIGRRARTIFFLVVFLELLIVIAIFGVVISAIFDKFPRSVFPIWIQIPIAVVLGAAVYRWKANVALATAAAVITMYGTVVVSHVVDGLALTMPALVVGGSEVLPATGVWVVVLLIYAYVASTLPVTVLLQPRDYINAWQLFIAMGALVLGVAASAFVADLEIVAPAVNLAPAGAPPLWPFLGVTIACGAISGFHCLVSSGTTAKQVRCETDAQFVGYGSMLMEGALAVLVLVSVSAGIGMAYQAKSGEVLKGVAAWNAHYASWGAAGGLDSNVEAVVRGAANMLGSIGIRKGVGVIIMGVFIASFAGTTLDTATRIQRYVISELAISFRLGALANRWVATAIAVVGAGALAFGTGASGKGALTLWPMFGAVNQLLAALALLLVTIYLRRRGTWGYLLTLGPCLFMLVLTVWAMVSKEIEFATKPVSETFPAYQKYILIVLNAGTLLLSLALAVEAFIHIARPRKCELKA